MFISASNNRFSACSEEKKRQSTPWTVNKEVTDVDNREEKLSHKLSPLDLCVLSSSGDNTALQTQSEILKKNKKKKQAS